jgi:hypothetical protein
MGARANKRMMEIKWFNGVFRWWKRMGCWAGGFFPLPHFKYVVAQWQQILMRTHLCMDWG